MPTSNLDAVMETLVDGAIVIDARGLIRVINPAGQNIFGYGADDLIGQNISRLMPEPYHSAHDDYLRHYLETGENRIIGIGREVEGLRSNGEIFPMSLAVGEMGHDGTRLFIGIIRDLTEERRREIEFDELQARHFHLSRVAAMNEMGAAIAHEINQPLSAAANYIETGRILASRQIAEEDPLLSILDKALEQNHRAAEIISRMRKFIERGDVQSETVHLGHIVDEALMLTLSKYRDNPVVVDRQRDPDAVCVQVDPVQIQQVMVNLVRNGCEAMAEQDFKQLTLSIQADSEHPDMSRI
ncbi:MAG: PAS domain S-box protein, partial [Pseudomonadota bacterium]